MLELECDYQAGGCRIAQYAAVLMHKHKVTWSTWLPADHSNQTNHQPTNNVVALIAIHNSLPESASSGKGSGISYDEYGRKTRR